MADTFKIAPDMAQAYREEYGKDSSDAQWRIFIDACERRRTLPGKGGIYFQLHSSNEWDADLQRKVRVKKATHIASIEFLQVLAERTGEYAGRTPTTFVYIDAAGELVDKKRPYKKEGEKFFGAEVTVNRKGRPESTVFASFDAYAVTYKENNVVKLNSMWAKFGPEQTAKCAFAAALRQAFPEDLGELYAPEEMARTVEDSAPDAPTPIPAPLPTVAGPVAVPKPTVEYDSKPMPELVPATEGKSPEELMGTSTMQTDPAVGDLQGCDTKAPDQSKTWSVPGEGCDPGCGPGIAQPGTQTDELPKVDATAPAPPETPAAPAPEAQPATVEGPAPNADYLKFCDRAAKFANDVLTPKDKGNMTASKGLTVTGKVKKFILRSAGKTELKSLTVSDWTKIFALLEATAKKENGALACVALIEAKL
jgi:hypothetical protein